MLNRVQPVGSILPIAGLVVLMLGGRAWGQNYTVVDLGASVSEARAINDLGHVTGTLVNANSQMHAFVYKNGTFKELLPANSMTVLPSFGYAINKSDQVSGYTYDSQFHLAAARWQGDAVTLTGFLPGGTYDYAYGINDAGHVVGFSARNDSIVPFNLRAFRWDGTAMTDLGALGGSRSVAWGINNKGQVVGEAEEANAPRIPPYFSSPLMKPVLWENGTATCLCNGVESMEGGVAYAINESGQIVGSCKSYDADGTEHREAVVWQNGQMLEIGALGGTESDAWGNNEAGEVVGWAKTASGAQHAFFWKNGVMTDLNSLIPAASGWELTFAYDINNNGQIVGYGTFSGAVQRSFVLNPSLVATPPSITGQPSSVTVTAGSTATFSVAASGTAPLSYQWRKNGSNIGGANSSSYTTPATTTGDSGSLFSVVVSNSAGSATSNNATLTVNPALVPPSISTQPASKSVTAGQTATFSVVSAGSAPLFYQWRKNGSNIGGASGSSYTTPATTSADNGSLFSVVVSNSVGSVTSNNATLTVTALPNQPPVIVSAPWANPNPVAFPNNSTVNVAASDPDSGPQPLTYAWSVVSGPGTVSFSPNGTTSSNSSSAGFSAIGTYTLRVTVSDGAVSVTGNVTVTVVDATPPTGAVTSIVLKGSADGTGSALASVTVNGIAAAIAGGTWSLEVPVVTGTNTFNIVIRDQAGNQTTKITTFTK